MAPFPNIQEHPSLLTETEAARWLCVRPATLRRWRWAGQGPRFIKVGGAVRYDREEVVEYLKTGVRSSTSDTGPSANQSV